MKSLVRKSDSNSVNRTAATGNSNSNNSNSSSSGRSTSTTLTAMLFALLVLYTVVAPSSSLSVQQFHHRHSTKLSSPRFTSTTASSSQQLSMALGNGGNYLDNMNNNENNDNTDGTSNSGGSDYRDGINSRSNSNSNSNNNRGSGGGWGNFFNRKGTNNNNNSNSNGGGPSGRASQDVGRGNTAAGVGTAIRPSMETTTTNGSNNGGGPPNGGYTQKWRPNGGNNNGGNNGVSKVFDIRQPQDLLDFVISDERLSIVKVYASWCKTCQVFDIRYRKLASQLGDKYGDAAGNELLSRGNVRFAQMKFDDPNNEEMCKLLNATKLPYILIYKGSQGKVADFQCGPAKFQMLIDAVNEFADPMEEMMSGGSVGEEEMEWRVAQEQEEQQRQMQQQQQQQRERSSPLLQQEQPRPAYGDIQYQSSIGARSSSSSSSDATALKRKDEEINRLLTEMSNLRNKFDRSIAAMKDERQKETGYLQQQIDEQRKQYEKERMALSAQIDDLTREMMDREKEYRTGEDATSYQLRQEMAKKEKEYQETLTGLNLQITEMERTLFKSKNELQYNSDTSASDRKRLVDQINVLEEEILSLTSKNEELEKELIEEKRLVVASTEEANRVLLQLNKIRNNEDEERKELVARVKELEAQISNRENEIVQGTGNLARDLRREMDGLKEEHEQERELMAARIIELEQELSYREETWQSDNQSFEEGERLAQRIVELEKSIDERDRLLKTSNKATDILLDNMEAQKQGYEEELERTTSLVNELEEAIAGREQEMQMLQERLSALERLDGNGRPQEQGQNQGKGPGAFSFADAVQMSEGFARAAENGGNFGGAAGGALAGEREARLAAEKEVNKLMGFLKDREEEINRMRSGGSEDYGQNGAYGQQNGAYGQNNGADGSQEQKSFFDKMFGTRQPKDPNAQTNDGMNDGWNNGMNDGMMANEYDMLNEVLLPDEVSPPRGRRGGGQEDVYVGAGSPFGGGGGSRGGGGGGEGIYSNSMTPSPAAASPPAGLPTPAQAFERRLAENPIVPSGAFGGSKPTASFFQSSSSGGGWDDSTISAYAAQSSGSQDMAPSPSYNGEEPALPPAKSFEPRPATPSPRQPIKQAVSDNIYAGAGTATRGGSASGRGRVDNVRPDNTRPSDNIYSGAGTASGGGGTASSSREYSSGRGRVDNVRPDNTRARAGEMTPSPSVVSEPSAPLPTPAQAFERRLAENPIVPSGAFGGSRPTSHFFSQTKPSPPAASASSEEEVSPQDEAQAKWRSMDDAEKKRIASEAYKTFEKQITDSRNTPNSKGGVPPSRTNPPNLLSSLSRGEPVESQDKPVASQGTPASQREIERKKHQDMVKAAEMSPDKAKFGAPASAAVDAKKPENGAKPGQTANDIQKSAAAASAKRMSLAERAAQAELDRKAEERRIKGEQRRARESGGRVDGTQVNVKNEAAKRPEPTTNVKRKVAAENVSPQNKKSNIEQKEKAAQATNKIDSKAEPSVKSKTAGSDRLEKEPKGFGKNQVEKKASPVGETSKTATKQNTSKGEASEKQGKQTATVSAKGGNKKAPSKNGLKAPKYDVIVKSPSEMDMQPLDMPQLLQGSLTDLLKKGPKRGSGERPRGRSDY
eukprot:CAMPEP_0113377136 /NCGR_PEP_ID=MMETSP0013_2-20120614/3004_1 /TAXON_ID=2843 ORGANISM="Skeletonema costatum, Strain 1716" /NCGR_SAMPLE_ID=MMETSP0013_2 /ASSEMBLY_ACC=CAM_ASM_000158 /LENGTH=1610 /DNA_ID=CAMNT_0000259269 /DNA_START=224 /DNA_END=5056 /DNA_ORIENTATION=- /assembly_acc=CAM_ASM_000158